MDTGGRGEPVRCCAAEEEKNAMEGKHANHYTNGANICTVRESNPCHILTCMGVEPEFSANQFRMSRCLLVSRAASLRTPPSSLRPQPDV